jgi:serine acetyltransferase
MIDHVVLDLKRHDQVRAKISKESCGAPVNTGLPAVILYRVYRYMYLKNWRILPRVLWQLSITLFKTDIPPSSDIGPGLVLMSGTCTVIVGRVGKNVTFGPSAGCGASGKRDVGAGTGIPLIGDFVTLGSYAAILGGIHIQDRMVVPEYSQIYSEKRKRMILGSGAGL